MKKKLNTTTVSRFTTAAMAFTLGLGLIAGRVQAAPYYWDTDGGAIGGFGNTAGTWGTSAFWSSDNTGNSATANTTITTSDGINFGTATLALGSTASGVTVSGAVNVNSITFGSAQTTAVTLSGGTSITLGGTTPTITVNNASNTISSILTGTSLTKAGTGTLTLSGANTYTGNTIIDGGVLRIGNGGASGSLYSPTVSGTGNLTFGSASSITLNNDSGLVYSISGGALNVNKTISGTGTLNVTGNQGVNFAVGTAITTTGAQTYSATATTATRYYGFNLSDSATVTLSSSAGNISMTGMLGTANANTGNLNINTSAGNGSVTLNTAVGVSNVDFGLNSLTAIAGTGTITLGIFNGQSWGTVNAISLIGGAINSTVNMTAFTTLVITNSSAGTFSGIIGGSGTLTKSGAGTLTLSGNNTHTGKTTISEGTLKLQGGAFSTTPRTYSIALGAILNLDGTIGIPSGTTTINGSGTLRITGGQWSNGIGLSRNVTMSLGAGGLIDVQSGASLQNGGWSAFTWTANQANLNVDGTFDVWDGNNVTVGALTGVGTITKGYNANPQTMTVGAGNGSGVFSGKIANALSTIGLIKKGTGTQTLAGNNTYSGGTTVSNGVLLVNGSITGTVSVASGAYLGGNGAITGNVTYANGAFGLFTNTAPLRFTGPVTLNNNTVHLTLSDNLPDGTYLLATNTTSGFSGVFAATPVIDSGSTLGAIRTITTDASAVRLIVSSADTLAPSPDPMTFAVNPRALGVSTMVMTATTATDVSSPVEYYFTNTVNGNTSGWISGTVWTNTGLTKGTLYGYQVKARDAATVPNETAFSSIITAQTQWLEGYLFRKPLALNAGSGAGTGYQVQVQVGESSGASGYDLLVDNQALNFPNDIRFTDDDGNTELAHWLEKTTGSAPDRTATFWVKVNDNLDSAQSIMVYYSKSAGASASNGDATFIFFDDFSGSIINTSKWAIDSGTGWTVTGGELRGQNTTGRIRSQFLFSSGIILETKYRSVTRPTSGNMALGFFTSSTDCFGWLNQGGGDYLTENNNWTLIGNACTVPVIARMTARATQVDFTAYRQDTGAAWHSQPSRNIAVANDAIALGRRYDNDSYNNETYDAFWDWIRVRKNATTSPTLGTSGLVQTEGLAGLITAPANGRIFLSGSSVTVTVSVVNGTLPYDVTFYTNSAVAWSTNSAEANLFGIDLGALSDGTYTSYVTVTDSVSSNATSLPSSFTVAPDLTAPTPNPMTFAVNPVAQNASTMVMTATTATDVSSPVEYYFTNTVNGTTSGWISSTVWTNTGLTGGTAYGYQVKARDAVLNETAFSSVINALPAPRTLYWDGGTEDIGTDGNTASGGGSGSWNNSLLNWDAGVAPHVAWIATQDTAVFGGTPGTVTLGSDIQASGLTFGVSGYTLGGAYTLSLGANNNIVANEASPGRTITFADGLVVTNINVVQVGSGSGLGNNSLTLTNGVRMFVTNQTFVGIVTTAGTGSSGNTLTITGGAADSIYSAGNQNLYVGFGSGALAAGNQLVIGAGGTMTNVASIEVGKAQLTSVANAAIRNAIRVVGGKLFTTGPIRIGMGSGGSPTTPSRTNALMIAEGGLVNVAGGLYIGVTGYKTSGDNTTEGNSLTITNGGQLFTKADCYIGSDADNLWMGNPAWPGILYGNSATVVGSLNGTNAMWDLAAKKLYVGYAGFASTVATNNRLTVGISGVVTNISTLTVKADNTVALAPGGRIYATAATLAGTMNISTDDALTPNCGRLTVSGALNVTNVTLNLVIPAKPKPGAVYIFGAYGSFTGPFKGTNGLPEGCLLDMNYKSLKQIALLIPHAKGTLISFQ